MATREGAVRIAVNRDRDNKLDAKKPEHFNEMSKNMEDELEKRKKDWEKDVERLQEDFFKAKISSEGTSIPVKKGAEIFDIINTPSISEQADGSRLYAVRFDVKGFDADDINVKAEGNKLTVQARHEEDFGKGSKATKQFNRSVDLPPTVDPDKVLSYLSDDGILTLEAPVEKVDPEILKPEALFNIERRYEYGLPDDQFEQHRTYGSDHPGYTHRTYHTSTSSRDPFARLPGEPTLYDPGTHTRTYHSPGGSTRTIRTTTSSSSPAVSRTHPDPFITSNSTQRRVISCDRSDSPTEIFSSSPGHESSSKTNSKSSSPSIESTEYGKKLNLVVDIGTDYEASDITVRPRFRKISVHAVHEENKGGRSSRREFSRDFDIGEEIEPRTLRASLTTNGKLHIGASVIDNKEHDIVLGFVIQDLPRGGRQVKVERD